MEQLLKLNEYQLLFMAQARVNASDARANGDNAAFAKSVDEFASALNRFTLTHRLAEAFR